MALTTLVAPSTADAFCGFYVAGAETSLYNNATQAVLMREGTRTILSIQNNYKGPAEDFAMVVPVPIILQADNVKTLPEEIFAKVDTLTAPRLVEYWEQDPCTAPYYDEDGGGSPSSAPTGTPANETSVVVEAEFTVGEYNVVVLSATDATSLETWLTGHNYNIPEDSAPYLEPYVAAGMYFFVAEVDVTKVEYNDGRVVLSPLRFHYDTEEFSLPIRLGLINSQGSQDLLIYTLGQNQRYEIANYPNVTIPTNIRVEDDVRNHYGEFYESLYQATLDANPGAIVTEYSWSASSCDPCPGPVLEDVDYLTLGADVLPETPVWGWTLTRLHARYTADNLGADLIFKEAPPITGGRGVPDVSGNLPQGVEGNPFSDTFQGRYVIEHFWTAPVECTDPNYGYWGGPWPGETGGSVQGATSPNTRGEEPAFSEGDPGTDESQPEDENNLSDWIEQDIPEIGVQESPDDDTPAPTPSDEGTGCACDGSGGSREMALTGLMGLVFLRIRRKAGTTRG